MSDKIRVFTFLILVLLSKPVLGKVFPFTEEYKQNIGLIRKDSWGGSDFDSRICFTGADKYFIEGMAISIIGYKTCFSRSDNKTQNYIEFYYNKEIYFTEAENVFIGENISFEILKSIIDTDKSTYAINAFKLSELMFASYQSKALRLIESSVAKGLVIIDYSLTDESEYTESTSLSVEFYNPTNKTIKYIWFTVTGLNPVGDAVFNAFKGSSKFALKGVGPIPSKTSSKFEFKNAWFTDLVETVIINSVKVQYMDGSIKTITNPKSIMMSQVMRDAINKQ
jgi:hypothetical protein